MPIEERDQVTWNIAAEEAKEISALLKKTTDYFCKGDWRDAFIRLSAMRNRINPYLKLPQQKNIDDMELKCDRYCNRWYSVVHDPNKESSRELGRLNWICKYLVRDYWRILMQCLKEMGFLPTKEDRTKLGF